MKNVSACVIAKNEEQNLPTWLESMKGLADELIVVDTGSDDRTAEIAEAAGAKVFHYAWNKDFAAAKNYAMNQAHGKWLLILDADEYIRPEDYPAVKRAIRDYEHQADVIGFVTLLVNIDRDDHDRFLSDGVQIRLVRNLPQLRYHGNVHETLRYDGPGRGTKRMQFVRGITVWHTGYSSGIIRQKSQRNLAILLAEQETNGSNLYLDGYLADCYYSLHEFEKVIEHASRAARHSDTVAIGRETRLYGIWIQSLVHLRRPEEEIDTVVAEAKKAYPLSGEFSMLAGDDAWRRGNYQKAEAELRDGLTRFQNFLEARKGDDAMKGDGTRSMVPFALSRLAKLALWRGRRGEALELCDRALQQDVYSVYGTELLLELHAADDDASLIASLNRWYDPQRDARYLLGLLPARRGRVRIYYARQGGVAMSDGEKYLAAGKLAAASAAITEDMQVHLGLGLLATAHGEKLDTLGLLLPARWRRAVSGASGEAEQRIRRQIERLQAGMQAGAQTGAQA